MAKNGPIKWRTRPGIPGCWGESGAYYGEHWDEERRTYTELWLLDEIRTNRRNRIIQNIVWSLLIPIVVFLAAGLIWLKMISR